jgi:hypothetical protein
MTKSELCVTSKEQPPGYPEDSRVQYGDGLYSTGYIYSGHMLGTGVSNRRRDWWPKKNERRRKQSVNGDPRVGDTLYLDLQPTGLRTGSRFQRLLGKDIYRQFCLSPRYKAAFRMVHEVTLQRATDRRYYMSAHLESCRPRFSSFVPPCSPIYATFYSSLHISLLVRGKRLAYGGYRKRGIKEECFGSDHLGVSSCIHPS